MTPEEEAALREYARRGTSSPGGTPMTPTPDLGVDLDRLLELAEKAERSHWDMWSAASWDEGDGDQSGMWRLAPFVTLADRDLAIAADPSTVSELIRRLRAAEAGGLDAEFDPDHRWKPGEHDDLRIFVSTAARNMFVRLREKSRAWGRSWRDGYYPDFENIERLRRAVDHLVASVDIAHGDDPPASAMSEPWKRAADVANQAFMLADPMRGWHEDAARRAALRESTDE